MVVRATRQGAECGTEDPNFSATSNFFRTRSFSRRSKWDIHDDTCELHPRQGGESKQVNRFLSTADWLRRRGNENLTTAAVTKALRDQKQKRLTNPSDCLNNNVSKGYCEKGGGGFFITPDGLTKLGHD